MNHKPRNAILLLAMLVSLIGAPAMALPPAPSAMDKAETRVVLIEEKAPGPHYIYVKERAFRVEPEATIQDGNGNALTLETLPVPCKARITFYLFGDNRRPYVTRIILLN